MKRILGMCSVAVTLLAAGCGSYDVPNYNNESLNSLIGEPTAIRVATAVQGLEVAARQGSASDVLNKGVQGRETYVLTPETPGSVTERLIGPLTPLANGSGEWANEYLTIKQGNVILKALDAMTSGFTDQNKEAVRGFVKTFQAQQFLVVITGTDVGGAAIDVDRELTADPAPIASRDAVYARIRQLLDQADTHLANGGTSFPFKLSPGFTGFTTPAAFRQFNRGLKARVDLYEASLGLNGRTYADVLTDLTGSFITTTAGNLAVGVYHSFSTTSGDIVNTNYDPAPRALFGHPSLLLPGAYQLRADASPDLRVTAKTFRRAAGPFTFSGVSSDVGLKIYNDNGAPIPVLRNEELILIRAEARLNTGDRPGAVSDINVVRQQSGGLDPIADPGNDPAVMNEIVYNRLWSLLFEGHRWVDMRRWGLLATLPRDVGTHRIFTRFPIPDAECQPRNPKPSPGCTNETGI
jgi:hypothetical protein